MFDMGGVVAKHTDSTMERQLLEDFGIVGHYSFSSVDPTLPSLLAEHSKARIDEQEVWEQFSLRTGIAIPPHTGSLWGKYFRPELDPYVVAIIEELKSAGYRVVCATNTEEAHYLYHRKAGQYDLFDEVYASLTLKEAKPDRAFFEKILSFEGVQPSEVLFVDDYPENCEAASDLGINSYLFADPVDLRWHLIAMELL